MKKKIASILIVMLSVFTLIGCGTEKKAEEPAKEIKVIVPDGLPAMSAAELINDNKEIEKGIKVNYTINSTPLHDTSFSCL